MYTLVYELCIERKLASTLITMLTVKRTGGAIGLLVHHLKQAYACNIVTYILGNIITCDCRRLFQVLVMMILLLLMSMLRLTYQHLPKLTLSEAILETQCIFTKAYM